jgi:hypothetical protein
MERGLKGNFGVFGTSYTHVINFSLGFEWVLYKYHASLIISILL